MVTAMLDSRYKGRRRGVAVREGSVRQARLEASLSLAQVAAGEVSRTAIHLIEYGRVKPSIETLRVIARQTRKPIEYFLLYPDAHADQIERHKELRELETLTLVRDFGGVIKLGLTLLDKRWSEEDRARTRFYLGQAYCRLVEPHEALLYLPPARAQFELREDEHLAVDALDWEASAWGLLEDPKAITMANEALERCRKIDPRPQQLEARILGHLANAFVVARSWAAAISHYHAAVDAASAVKDLLQLAKMHHGLGTTYQQLRQPATARQHFDKALALYSIESDLSAVYRVENDLGNLLLQEGQIDSAERHFLTALAGAEELNMNRRGRGFILANLGEVSWKKGRLEEARRYLNEALEAGEVFGERIVLTEARVLLGRLDEEVGNRGSADDHFLEAIRILDGLEMPNRLRDCHMAYAQVLEDRGDLRGAIQHLRLAAEIAKAAALGIPSVRQDDQTSVLREQGQSVS
jgi:tetratricopeptide (TPR) repeat protein